MFKLCIYDIFSDFSLLKYITQESGTVGESVDLNSVADKANTEKEKLLLDKMKVNIIAEKKER